MNEENDNGDQNAAADDDGLKQRDVDRTNQPVNDREDGRSVDPERVEKAVKQQD